MIGSADLHAAHPGQRIHRRRAYRRIVRLERLQQRANHALVFNLAQALDRRHAQAIGPGVQHHFERQQRGRAEGSRLRTLALGDQEPHLILALAGTPAEEFEHLRRAAAHTGVRMAQQRQQRGGHPFVGGSLERQDGRLLHIRVAVAQGAEQRLEALFVFQLAQGGGGQAAHFRVLVPQRLRRALPRRGTAARRRAVQPLCGGTQRSWT